MTARCFAAGALLACLCAGGPPARAQSFDEALAQAYLYNPQLLAERQRLRETDEGVPRALSGWRPRVMVAGSIGRSVVSDSLDPHGIEHRYPQEATASVTQPLYTGGRVAAQLGQAEAQVRAERAQLRATEGTVLLAAAGAYLDVARDAQVVELDERDAALLERTLHAAELQVQAGEVTQADAAQAQARAADGRAALAAANAQLAASRAAFEAQTGMPPGDLAIPAGRLPGLPATRDAAVAKAMEANFDVAAARETLDATRAGIDVARSALRPSVNVQGSLARVKSTDVQAPRQRDNVAEATVQLSIPLYQGGLVAAETRQAREAAGRTEQMLDLARRRARQLAATAWDAREAAAERVAQRQVSVAANEVAVRGITRQQSVGARTLIEVLNAQQELFAARVALVSARHDLVLETLRLLQAGGGLTAEALALPAPSYDPVRHYDDVRNKWGGLSTPP